MANVMIRCDRSDALAECGLWTTGPESIVLGPFEYVELTYQYLRTSPEGEHIGAYVASNGAGEWYIDGHDEPFSDITIYAE